MQETLGLEWRPNAGQQEFALRIPPTIYEILYGGARGGGKTDAGIYWLIKHVDSKIAAYTYQHPRFRALVLRRNSDDLSDWLDRADHVFRSLGARLIRTPHPRFVFPSGAVIRCGHLKDKDAYTKYQGHEYQRLLIEELTQIPEEKHYDKVLGSCRSTVPDLPAQVFLTTNPGGKGHAWVRNRFIKRLLEDEQELGPIIPNVRFLNQATDRFAIYIPARIEDNPVLVTADPHYVRWLDALKLRDPNLWKAWRQGDWDAFEGQAFSEWLAVRNGQPWHVVDRFAVALKDCRKIAALDWGWNDPTSVHWLAQAPENRMGVKRLYIYRELYKNKLTPLQWAEMLGLLFRYEPIDYLVLPHDAFSSQQGYQSVAQVFRQYFAKKNITVRIRQAESLSKNNRPRRVTLMHQMLSAAPDGLPYLQVHQNCTNLIRTLPELVYDEDNPEDIDTDQEDHAYDSVSYGLMTIRPQTGDPRLINTQPLVAPQQPKLWPVDPHGQIKTDDILGALSRPSHNNQEPEA